ncbi:TorD/DmsD family molecular chaperone [Adlercreutzia sp. ZJ141]|uniref:TorD/DmsD family molecular chaperone n=1 Tax=Adlercreutzia sp. ZJ141 TaxID=2709406 RepID=UPI0013ED670C|nr:molecular chaperone TorD family protein [Adlercreutzia sp. ZJ141]
MSERCAQVPPQVVSKQVPPQAVPPQVLTQTPPQVVPNENQTQAQAAQAFALLAETLSRCLLRPTEGLAGELQSGALSAQLESLINTGDDEELVKALAAVKSEELALAHMELTQARLTLEVEYNRLFVGPGKVLAPPYESFFLTAHEEGGRGRLRGPSERAVRACYAKFGYAMPELFVDFPDHIAIELEFIAMLANEEARAWCDGNEDITLFKQRAIDDFCRDHLACWVAPFASAVAAGSRRALYPAIATLAKRLA